LRMIRDSQTASKHVLELACGQGDITTQLASFCDKVTCIDLSSVAVAQTLARCRHYGQGSSVSGCRMPCERLAFPDGSFDLAVGRYVLHHVDIAACAREVHRVLKAGGEAFFLEWIEWPPFEWLRTSRPVLRFFSREASVDRHITQDERKLNRRDLQEIESVFGRVDTLRFHSLARVGSMFSALRIPAMKLDFQIYRLLPAFRRTGGSVLISCRKTS